MSTDLLDVQAYQGIILAVITRERLTDVTAINTIGAELLALLDRYEKINLVLDLGRVAAMSSAMLGKLVAVHKKVLAYKGRMSVAGVRKEMRPLFTVTSLDKLFDMRESAQKVILEFRRTSRR